MVLNDGPQELDRLFLVHGEDGLGDAVRVRARGQRLSAMLAGVTFLEAHKPLLWGGP